MLDLLVGTQMIAKGLDFPRVTLVGVISADGGLHLPDLRAAERTFQLLAQVSGRAGRSELKGRIVIQTHAPEHEAITCAARHDYAGFAEGELTQRRELGYPPYGRLLRVVCEDEDLPLVQSTIDEIAAVLGSHLDETKVQILGPAPAPMAMLRGRHRMHILLRGGPDSDQFPIARNTLPLS